ncbi:AAA family ATPase [Legionella dresdenensis]|uniref:AAA family ATPase n=1 Tax=Legionella dresdenensis TaxID=450200 RepID=A0ABV8CGQ6_9GAMM
MLDTPNKLIVISGCSGGGKTTLINELSKMGYAVVPEAATEIVNQQLNKNGQNTPWQDRGGFCKLLIEKSLDDFHRAKAMTDIYDNTIFFDRSYLEGIRYYKSLNTIDSDKYDFFINNLRYFHAVYITPPWEEIYCQNETRKHSFKKSVDDFEKVVSFYLKCGYQTIELPKVDVRARVQFILSSINQYQSLQ